MHLKIAIIETLEGTEAAYNKDYLLQTSGKCREGKRAEREKIVKLSIKICLKKQTSTEYNQAEEEMDKS